MPLLSAILQHRFLGLLVCHLLFLTGWAQDSCVIVDKETGTPIRHVNVTTDKGERWTTDYRGRVAIRGHFTSATISHASYLTRIVERPELKDTLWLLPRENRLSEVVVWGEEKKNINSVVKSATANLAAYAPPQSGISFDFAQLLRKKPLSRKARKKNKQLLRDWDKLYGDPPK